MKQEIKELRIKIDGLAQLVESLDRAVLIVDAHSVPDGVTIEDLAEELRKQEPIVLNRVRNETVEVPFLHSLYESHKSLLLSKAWLGKVLSALGEETPYKKDGERKSVEDIEKPADKKNPGYLFAGEGQKKWYDKTYIEKIDWLREEIKKIIEQQIHELRMQTLMYSYDANIFLAQNHLSEARFHLGFELARIKKQEEKA